MTEDYLHLIWKSKRVPFHKIKPIHAHSIRVIEIGTFNENQKGPDFQFGHVEIDHIPFYGHIEIHVKSSDWYKHNHHLDKAYNSVVLHVVYEYDEPIIQNGIVLPTIELKNHIDFEHFLKFKMGRLHKTEFPCRNLIQNLDHIHLEEMKMKAFLERMQIKLNRLNTSQYSEKEIFYQLLASAFGTSINKQGFGELVNRVPYQELKRLKSAHQQYQLILAESGLIQSANSNNSTGIWHFKGTRPKNFPTIRIKQFAQFVSNYDFDTSFILLAAKDIKLEFHKLIKQYLINIENYTPRVSTSFTNLLLINAVVPLMWYKSELMQDEKLQSKAIELLELLPAEKNKYTTKWLQCQVKSKNAFDSQSLLSLYQYHCNLKKCLTCGVGIKLLESKS